MTTQFRCLDTGTPLTVARRNFRRIEPGEERARGPVISLARVTVTDRRGKEFEEAADGVLAGAGDRGRHDDVAGDRNGGSRCLDRDELVHGA